MIYLEKIRLNIADAIKQSGLTQTELANKLGIRQQQISCYVKCEKLPSLDTFAKLCAILELEANEILCVDDYFTCPPN
ncbi:MAG: helix-turn-helix domain-containing protein [Clostridia bacterium]|nr:helix-turn-helix domain-containing protein [Clostridia bacterium]MDE7329456.1 helix-turn-helix domain-containing protein [Clostridia bacterium]